MNEFLSIFLLYLDTNGGKNMAVQLTRNTNPQPAPIKQEVEVVESYDIVADREAMSALVGSPEVDALCSQISVDDANSIVTFGSEVANEIAKASDVVLNSMSMDKLTQSSEMMNALATIMEKFDIDEIKKEPTGFAKLFHNAKKQLQKLLDKYHTMGEDVDKIYIELKKYESEIKKSNQTLQTMFDSNVNMYHELVKYILAGEQASQEIGDYLLERQADFEKTQDASIQFEIQALEQAKQMMDARTQDLRTAETVAMQSVPMIKTMQFSNLNLVRKINSAFIITLPVFKQALAQAMLLKRQAVMADSMQALDDKTNELLLKNAQNTVAQSKQIAAMAAGSSVKIETLEQSWQTIMQGIADTKQIQAEAAAKREADAKRLAQLKDEYKAKYGEM